MHARQGPPPGRKGISTRVLVALIAAVMVAAPLIGLAGVPAAGAAVESVGALARINEARAAIGVPPLRANPALESAATAHANYYRLNFGDASLAGMGLHYEDPGKPGFTGTDFAARARVAGYSGSINENIGLSGDLLVSLDWFMGTINHRLPLLDPRYTDIGFGVINDGRIKIEVIDFGTIVWRNTIEPAWEPWPAPDATGVGLRFDGESNFALAGAKYPVGYPITLKYNGPGVIAFTKARLTTGADAQPVPFLGQAGTGFMTKNTYVVAATTPLQPGTAYSVTIEGTLDGKPFARSWGFTTKGTTTAPVLPPGVGRLDPAAAARWKAADYDVWRGVVARTWTWGPDVLAVRQEQHDNAAGGVRTVYYFDKSRMEINDPQGDRTSQWFITNGLLVREMIAGQLQTGTGTFAPFVPSPMPLSGERAGSNAVTYAALAEVASLDPGQHTAPSRVGAAVTETIDARGAVGSNLGLGGARYGAYDPTLGHNIADVFWRWLGAQPIDWVYTVGYPLTEPYWTQARINGVEVWVLVQAFERRILTFVPGNTPGWQVEAGNVGRHYYEWRYGEVLK